MSKAIRNEAIFESGEGIEEIGQVPAHILGRVPLDVVQRDATLIRPGALDGRRAERERGRQVSMLGEHPEMDEHVGIVEKAVKDLAARLIDESDGEGDLAVKTRKQFQFVTAGGQVMQATMTINIAAKPAKAGGRR